MDECRRVESRPGRGRRARRQHADLLAWHGDDETVSAFSDVAIMATSVLPVRHLLRIQPLVHRILDCTRPQRFARRPLENRLGIGWRSSDTRPTPCMHTLKRCWQIGDVGMEWASIPLQAIAQSARSDKSKKRVAHWPRPISATQTARNFRAVLKEIEDTGETFHIERHGRRVAELRPVGVTGPRFTGRDLAELMRRLPPPDPEFGPDLARVRADCQPAPSRDPWQVWGSSSTTRS